MHTVKTNHLGVERWDFCTLDRGFEIEPSAGVPPSLRVRPLRKSGNHTDRAMGFAFSRSAFPKTSVRKIKI